jgi:hypothetical protein
MNAIYQGLTNTAGALQGSYDTLYWKEKNKLLAADNEQYERDQRHKQIHELFQHLNRLDALLSKAYDYIEELQKCQTK